jgi:hypothetical protein
MQIDMLMSLRSKHRNLSSYRNLWALLASGLSAVGEGPCPLGLPDIVRFSSCRIEAPPLEPIIQDQAAVPFPMLYHGTYCV